MLTALLTMGSLPVNAGAGGEPDKALKATIINAIKYPESAIDKGIEGEVLLGFRRDSLGRLEIIGVNSRESILADYVINTIQDLNIPDDPTAGTDPVYLRFEFVLL